MKKLCRILALSLLPLLLACCAAPQPEQQGLPVWYVGLDGVEEPIFASWDYEGLESKHMEVEAADGTGSFEGIPLADVLSYLGVSDYSSLTLGVYGGGEEVFTREELEDADAILAVKFNGEFMSDDHAVNWPWLVTPSGEVLMEWFAKITVNE